MGLPKSEDELVHHMHALFAGSDIAYVTSALVRMLVSAYRHFETREQALQLRGALVRFVAVIDSQFLTSPMTEELVPQQEVEPIPMDDDGEPDVPLPGELPPKKKRLH